jgi:hypothetical protein
MCALVVALCLLSGIVVVCMIITMHATMQGDAVVAVTGLFLAGRNSAVNTHTQ